MANYKVTEEQKLQFAGIYVLEYIINKPHSFDLLLSENDSDLEPILEWLMVKDCITIKDDAKYIPTEKGLEKLKIFMARYTDFLTMFDVYCAVDLNEGVFAFENYFDFEDTNSWKSYLNSERWEDLRIAVASFKKIDPVEIVFMSFINEGRFGKDKVGWQFELLLGTVWNEILEICNTALRMEDLGYEDNEGTVSGANVIKDIIEQGTGLMNELLKKEKALPQPINHESNWVDGEDDNNNERHVDQVTIVHHDHSYYDPWYNPWYISPAWGLLWFL